MAKAMVAAGRETKVEAKSSTQQANGDISPGHSTGRVVLHLCRNYGLVTNFAKNYFGLYSAAIP
jgi:hypothetical protein